VRSADTSSATLSNPVRVAFGVVIAAGQVPKGGLSSAAAVVRTGTEVLPSARIMTGALLPDGADAVIKQEDTERTGDTEFLVRNPVAADENVVPRGARMERGEVLLDAGEVLGPQALGILAAAHQVSTPVFRRPAVAVLALGDELVEPHQSLGPGSIPVTNLYVIAELVRRYGGSVINLGIAPDDPDRILKVLAPYSDPSAAKATGTNVCDLIITLGGSHKGDFDFVHSVLDRLGAHLQFDRIAMAPGASTLFATRDTTMFLGLPGTPAASWVACEALVRPVLMRLAGRSTWTAPHVRARLSGDVARGRAQTFFIPCRLTFRDHELHAHPIRGRHAREAPASLRADGLLRLDDRSPGHSAGEWATVQWVAD
jgi:molybdopterin molybdotransferase